MNPHLNTRSLKFLGQILIRTIHARRAERAVYGIFKKRHLNIHDIFAVVSIVALGFLSLNILYTVYVEFVARWFTPNKFAVGSNFRSQKFVNHLDLKSSRNSKCVSFDMRFDFSLTSYSLN